MTEETFPARLQAIIDQAGALSSDQIAALGDLWEDEEDLQVPYVGIGLALQGEISIPVVTNMELVNAWQRALDAAGNAGRANELDAAIAAGRAVKRDDRHLDDSPSEKNGSEEAVRSAVLAVAVKDLISDEDYQALTGPWQKVLGAL